MDNLQGQEQHIRDMQAPEYEDVRRRAYFRWFEIAERLVLKTLLKGVDRGSWVLDAGCATGRLTGFLQCVSDRLISVDFSHGSLKLAAKKYPGARYLQADLAALPFKRVFRTAVCLDVLHCLPEEKRRAAVRSLAGVIQPGGIIVASIWNRRSFNRIFRLPPEGNFKSGIYYQAMEEDEFQELFFQNGFRNIRVMGMGYVIYMVRSFRFTSTIYRVMGWLTIAVERFLTARAAPSIKSKAMYFILKATRSEGDNRHQTAPCP